MATLTLTDLDKELLNGLQVLTDQEIGRVQAHLAAGLPMKMINGRVGTGGFHSLPISAMGWSIPLSQALARQRSTGVPFAILKPPCQFTAATFRNKRTCQEV